MSRLESKLRCFQERWGQSKVMSFMIRIIPLFLLVAFGSSLAIVFTYFLLIDWAALDAAYVNFSAISENPPDLISLFSAQAFQNIHRINVFAEGVWVLQSLILAAIGLHGICTVRRWWLVMSLNLCSWEKGKMDAHQGCMWFSQDTACLDERRKTYVHLIWMQSYLVPMRVQGAWAANPILRWIGK